MDVDDAWPAVMSNETLKRYLDCQSDSTLRRRLAKLRQLGYSGPIPGLGHIRKQIDQALSNDQDREIRKQKMFDAARGQP